jgi:hypothetical protein
MRALTSSLLLTLALLFQSCSVDIASSMVPARTGPQFQQAFPSADTLIKTTDVAGTRRTLDTIPLPETKEHHDALRAALDSVETIDSQHLVLLTEAVALPTRLANPKSIRNISITSRDGRAHVLSRGDGEFSPVIDELLLAGAKKLSDVGPRSLGRLLSATQDVKAVVALSEILLERSDSGSTQDLESILEEMTFAGVRQDLCIEVLLPRGRLRGDRADIAIESMSFDSNRSKLIAAIYKSLDSLDAATLIRHTKLQSFDSGKIQVVGLGVPKLSTINGTDALKLVQTTSFDSGRKSILAELTGKLRLASTEEAMAFVRTNSFDSGRKDTLKTLLSGQFPSVSDDDLVQFASLGSFDDGRNELLKLVAPHFAGGFSRSSATRLLGTFSFDSGRLDVVRLFRADLQKMSEADRRQALRKFSMSSGRQTAQRMLEH